MHLLCFGSQLLWASCRSYAPSPVHFSLLNTAVLLRSSLSSLQFIHWICMSISVIVEVSQATWCASMHGCLELLWKYRGFRNSGDVLGEKKYFQQTRCTRAKISSGTENEKGETHNERMKIHDQIKRKKHLCAELCNCRISVTSFVFKSAHSLLLFIIMLISNGQSLQRGQRKRA